MASFVAQIAFEPTDRLGELASRLNRLAEQAKRSSRRKMRRLMQQGERIAMKAIRKGNLFRVVRKKAS